MNNRSPPPPADATSQGEGLLDIKAAAHLLRVSEVSLRRWTDAGRLPCTRVGGRRERRFRRADLEAMLLGGHRAAAPGESAPTRAACVALEDMQLRYGSHLCAFYQSDEGRLKLAVPFLAAGLRLGDACFLVASADTAGALRAALLDDELGGLAASALDALIVQAGAPDPGELLDWFRAAFMHATARGRKCRVLGDMACFLHAGAPMSAVLDFESAYDRGLARQFPVLSLCQYDSRAFSGVEVIGALKCHADTFDYPLTRFLGI